MYWYASTLRKTANAVVETPEPGPPQAKIMPRFSDVISRIFSFSSLEKPTSSAVFGVLARLRILTMSRSAPCRDGRAHNPEFVFRSLQLGP